ncbi:MAG: Ig-like domain-containing protein [Clostridia bacterium]|nr:Ig-like domain-containing protein [Clostridia bacterium]
MKKSCIYAAVVLVLTALCMAMFVHAGDLPPIPLTTAPTVPEVSTEYEVPVTIEDLTTAPLRLSSKTLRMAYKDTAELTASVRNVTWSSSDEKVVQVGQDGTLTAKGIGKATVTATAKDGRTATCKVTVRFTAWQWVIMLLLFGWIWY